MFWNNLRSKEEILNTIRSNYIFEDQRENERSKTKFRNNFEIQEKFQKNLKLKDGRKDQRKNKDQRQSSRTFLQQRQKSENEAGFRVHRVNSKV